MKDTTSVHEAADCAFQGKAPGEFVDPHDLATDSNGNLYSSETAGGRRARKFILKG